MYVTEHLQIALVHVFKVRRRLRVLRVKRRKLRVTRKTRNPHTKTYGFTRNLPVPKVF